MSSTARADRGGVEKRWIMCGALPYLSPENLPPGAILVVNAAVESEDVIAIWVPSGGWVAWIRKPPGGSVQGPNRLRVAWAGEPENFRVERLPAGRDAFGRNGAKGTGKRWSGMVPRIGAPSGKPFREASGVLFGAQRWTPRPRT